MLTVSAKQQVHIRRLSLDLVSVLQRKGLGNGDALQHIDQADDDSIAKLLADLRDWGPPAYCAPWQPLGNVSNHPNGLGANLVLVRRGAL